MLFGLISGPSTPANINAFNRIIVDELSQLKEGVVAYDSEKKTLTTLKGGVMMLVCDVPGAAKEQNRVQHNSLKACPHCHLEGEHSSTLDKVIFLGSRKFLADDHSLRQQTTFPSGKVENETILLRSNQEELAFSRCLDSFKVQELTGKVDKPFWSGFARDTGRHGSHQWFRLGLDLSQHHAPVEPMHAIKVIAEHIIRLLNGTDDGPKVRSEERKRGRFVECCPDAVYRTHSNKSPILESVQTPNELPTLPTKRSRSSKDALPPAPFTLTKQNKEKADSRLQMVRVPIDFGDMPATLFTKTYGMKSHTWMKIFTSGILRYILQDCLGRTQQTTLFMFLRCLEELYSRQLSVADMDRIEADWHQSLALMERDFPSVIQGAVMHFMHHLPHYLRKFGPVSNFWMFPFERLNSTLSRAIGSTRYPELAAIKHMKIQWMMSMLQAAGYLPPSRDPPSASISLNSLLTGGRTSIREMTSTERDQTKKQYQQMDVPFGHNTEVTVHHYGRKFIPSQGSTVTYRAAPMEVRTIQKSSVVCYAAPGGSCVGQVQYFFSHANTGSTYNFASLQWYGFAQPSSGDCYCVHFDGNTPCPDPVVLLDRLSPPLVHAWEGDVLWLPSLW